MPSDSAATPAPWVSSLMPALQDSDLPAWHLVLIPLLWGNLTHTPTMCQALCTHHFQKCLFGVSISSLWMRRLMFREIKQLDQMTELINRGVKIKAMCFSLQNLCFLHLLHLIRILLNQCLYLRESPQRIYLHYHICYKYPLLDEAMETMAIQSGDAKTLGKSKSARSLKSRWCLSSIFINNVSGKLCHVSLTERRYWTAEWEPPPLHSVS